VAQPPKHTLQPGEHFKLLSPLAEAPPGFTGADFHGAPVLSGAKFFAEAVVADRDEGHEGQVYCFSLADKTHGLSFHIGQGDDGTPLINYALATAFYRLRDGSLWAEHMVLLDALDVRDLGRRNKIPFRSLTDDMRPDELVLVPQRAWREWSRRVPASTLMRSRHVSQACTAGWMSWSLTAPSLLH
jgi:hypothetical protein